MEVMTMRIKTMVAVAAVALIGALAPVAQADAKAPKKAQAKVTIKAEGGGFHGKIKTSDPANCAEGRKVIVYKMLGDKPKPKHDQPYLYDIASKNGGKYTWSTGNSGVYKGYFYAKVKKTPYCKAAKSKVVKAKN
jgi:hypothetical protein